MRPFKFYVLFAVCVVLLLSQLSVAQESFTSPMFEGRERVNPEIDIVHPTPGGKYGGSFVVEVRNFDYLPELATNAGREFAVGVDASGNPLVFGEGHLHGWVFMVDGDGRIIRDDAGVPNPRSYFRFYGAGGAEYIGDRSYAWYIKQDELPPGRYKAFFQLQQNDHTAALQASAPAFPGIASVIFRVVGGKPVKPTEE